MHCWAKQQLVVKPQQIRTVHCQLLLLPTALHLQQECLLLLPLLLLLLPAGGCIDGLQCIIFLVTWRF
jgi:hypothetical protein